jgi:hypothetical protein
MKWFGTVFLIVATFAVSAPPSHAEATLIFEPSSGRCDATTTAHAKGLPPNTPIELVLALPQSDQEAGILTEVVTDESGAFNHLTVYLDDPTGTDDLKSTPGPTFG